jgi:hypothetical protein
MAEPKEPIAQPASPPAPTPAPRVGPDVQFGPTPSAPGSRLKGGKR